jgi:hypothetical protein
MKNNNDNGHTPRTLRQTSFALPRYARSYNRGIWGYGSCRPFTQIPLRGTSHIPQTLGVIRKPASLQEENVKYKALLPINKER